MADEEWQQQGPRCRGRAQQQALTHGVGDLIINIPGSGRGRGGSAGRRRWL